MIPVFQPAARDWTMKSRYNSPCTDRALGRSDTTAYLYDLSVVLSPFRSMGAELQQAVSGTKITG